MSFASAPFQSLQPMRDTLEHLLAVIGTLTICAQMIRWIIERWLARDAQPENEAIACSDLHTDEGMVTRTVNDVPSAAPRP